jgi:hypothetical protein
MKWIIGAEVDKEAYELFLPVRKKIQDELNRLYETFEYGDGLAKFHFLSILRENDDLGNYPEIFSYDSRKRKCDYRLRVDHERFLKASFNDRCKLLCNTIRVAIEHLKDQDVEDLDVDKIILDFDGVCKSNGW